MHSDIFIHFMLHACFLYVTRHVNVVKSFAQTTLAIDGMDGSSHSGHVG